MKNNIMIKIISFILIPLIFLFAFYVQFHGDFGPGGGFQAGVIFTAAIIFYSLMYGVNKTKKIIPIRFVEKLTAIGVLLYSGVGVACIFLGGEYLNYSVLRNSPVSGQHLGVLLVELGVFITVSSVMLLFFYSFTDRSN